ncbi:MAG TPA: DUF1236 domain-containing protein [Beijerinckiaceae bacterium]|nr:DUF1236 domain-containing protein [Beijerinckiaceae bacterium]
MSARLVSAAFAAGVLMLGSALAQRADPPTTGEPRLDAPLITELPINPDQEKQIRELAGKNGAVPGPIRMAPGATLPSGIELRDLPAQIGLGPYGYARLGDQVVIVDPDTRRIVHVVQ